jgi:hypothetical protein
MKGSTTDPNTSSKKYENKMMINVAEMEIILNH